MKQATKIDNKGNKKQEHTDLRRKLQTKKNHGQKRRNQLYQILVHEE